jgi:hypothetical protein
MNLSILAQQVQGDPSPIAGLIGLAVFVAIVASWWKVFTKGGQPGWGALIPIYNLYLILKMTGRPGWWLLLLFIPVVNVVVAIVITHGISTSFGKGIPFTIGLMFLPFIFYPILAWSDAVYTDPARAS